MYRLTEEFHICIEQVVRGCDRLLHALDKQLIDQSRSPLHKGRCTTCTRGKADSKL